MMKGDPIIGENWIWSIIFTVILNNNDLNTLISEFIYKCIKLIESFLMNINEAWLLLIVVIDTCHLVRPESIRSDHKHFVGELKHLLTFLLFLHTLSKYKYHLTLLSIFSMKSFLLWIFSPSCSTLYLFSLFPLIKETAASSSMLKDEFKNLIYCFRRLLWSWNLSSSC